jgi:hypothetical protein
MFDTGDTKLSGYQVYISAYFLFCLNVTTSLITYIGIQSHSSSCGISGRHGGIGASVSHIILGFSQAV